MRNNFNFVFFGTPEFAAIILDKLIRTGLVPAAVVCNPDRPVGRKKIITPPPTKVLALRYGIKIFQPETLDISMFKYLRAGEIDFAVVTAYAKIIPKEIIQAFKLGVIGVHPSLLPRHRGATPIQTAILEGDEVTGVTLFLMDEQVDHGPILAKRELTITDNDDCGTLTKKLAEVGAKLLIETLPKFLKGEIKPQVQNEKYATYTRKFTTDDAYVDLEKDDPILVVRKVKALNPEPGVWTIQGGKRTKILDAELRDGRLVLKKIQVEGKKPRLLEE